MRYIATALALVLGLSLAACDSGITDATNTDESDSVPVATQQGPAGPAMLAQQLNAVRNATKKYKSIEAAREDGYAAVSPYVPGMGFHFADGPPFGTDLEDPGVLVYFTNGSCTPDPGQELADSDCDDDDLILGAVEWLVPGNQENNPPNIFDDEGSPRHLKTTEEEGWHFESTEGFTGLHAWVHRGNPAGVFHPTNPNID